MRTCQILLPIVYCFHTFILSAFANNIPGKHQTKASASAARPYDDEESATTPSLACVMIIRDESENLAKNLPLWGEDFFDAFVVAVDDRTKDNSTQVLESTIKPSIPRYIFNHKFSNFGSARTRALEETYRRFSNISHVFVIDPDWKPVEGTIAKDDLQYDVDAYSFKIWDRSGMSTRKANWLALHQPNLTFAYYVHEDFRLPNGLPPMKVKELNWEVSEVEPQISWHTHVGHGKDSTASRSHKRYYFDLDLLQKEQADPKYRDSPHTLFYLGLVHSALLEGMEGYKPRYMHPDFKLTPSMQKHLDMHIMHLKRLVKLHMDSILTEYVYLSLRWLAYAHQFLLLRPKEAIGWYEKCIEFDPDRVDCKIELSKLHTFQGNHLEAWTWSKESLITSLPNKAWTHTYMYDCVTPLQVARASFNIMSLSSFDYLDPFRLSLGFLMMRHAQQSCKTIVFEPDDIFIQLQSAFEILYSKGKNILSNACDLDSKQHRENMELLLVAMARYDV